MPFTGSVFGRLTVLAGTRKNAARYCLCRCACGVEKEVALSSLRRGATKSCGCLNREMARERNSIINRTHGQTRSSEFKAWQGIWQRCSNQNDKDYAKYGGRGIGVCARWASFEAFLDDMGKKPSPHHSLDRVDVNGNYEPGNCRWTTIHVQNRNKRSNIIVSAFGRDAALVDFIPAGAHSAAYQRARKLIKRGVEHERAIMEAMGARQ
jgi:hypothetical protein